MFYETKQNKINTLYFFFTTAAVVVSFHLGTFEKPLLTNNEKRDDERRTTTQARAHDEKNNNFKVTLYTAGEQWCARARGGYTQHHVVIECELERTFYYYYFFVTFLPKKPITRDRRTRAIGRTPDDSPGAGIKYSCV